ncbi:MAG: hypothetical protein K2H20_02835, partial [Bacilli bacterium]|nr:hypothetical protein [Bacilli bacterium]
MSDVNKLVNGEVDFISKLNYYQKTTLLNDIRKMCSPSNRSELIGKCIDKLIEKFPLEAYMLVFDMEDYKEFCGSFIDKKFNYFNNVIWFETYFWCHSRWAFEYFKNNISKFKRLDSEVMQTIMRTLIFCEHREWLDEALQFEDLEFRGQLMINFLENNIVGFNEYYKNGLLDAFIIYDEKGNVKKIMEERYVSRIAYDILAYDLGIEKYNLVKDFILRTYNQNSLAERLDGVNVDGEDKYLSSVLINELESGVKLDSYNDVLFKDMDELFRTSSRYKFRLFIKYPGQISNNIRAEFYEKIEPFIKIDKDIVEHMFKVGLGDKFIEFTNKYMELSTGAKVIGNAGKGSTTRSFIVGDYVVKCSYHKWCDDLCPDLYLVAKNYEEEIARGYMGMIIGALEVQKHYKVPVKSEQESLVNQFKETIEDMGYSFTDDVLGMYDSPNMFYLDDYREADCENPEELPEWFKKDPIVLVDRDYVFKRLSIIN